MATVQAAGAAKNRNAQVTRHATQRRATIERASGASFQSPSRGTSPANRPVASRRSSSPRRSPRRSSGGSAPSRIYRPTETGKSAGNAVGALEAEFIGAIALLFLTLFTDTTSSYSDKMLAVMKRGTLIALTFFILALMSAQGPNAARFAKAFGALLDVGILLSVASTEMLGEIDGFFKGTWTSADSSGGTSAGAPAGQGGLGQQISGAAKAAGAPVVPGTGVNSAISNALLFIRQQPINTLKGIINDLKGLIP